MIAFKAKLKKQKAPDMKQSEFNALVREALQTVGEYWIVNYLPRHWESGATQRYQFASRSERTRAIKKRMRKVKPSRFGKGSKARVPAPKPPMPLLWSGDLRKDVLGRSVDEFNIRTTSTSKKTLLTIPVKIPHPLNPVNAGEIVRMNREEFKTLQALFSVTLAGLLDDAMRKTIAA